MIQNGLGKLGLICLFAMIAVVPLSADAQDAAKSAKSTIVGVWNATAQSDDGENTSVWTIERSGEAYTGKYLSSGSDQQRELRDIQFDGKELKFEFAAEVEGKEYLIKVVSKLDGNKLDGNWSVEKKKNGKEIASGTVTALKNVSLKLPGKWNTTASLPDGEELKSTMALTVKNKELSGAFVANEKETGIDKITVKGKSVRLEFKLKVEGDKRDFAIEAAMKSAKSLDGKWILLDSDGKEEASGKWVAERVKDETSDKDKASEKE